MDRRYHECSYILVEEIFKDEKIAYKREQFITHAPQRIEKRISKFLGVLQTKEQLKELFNIIKNEIIQLILENPDLDWSSPDYDQI